jgi:WD40 repeat protein
MSDPSSPTPEVTLSQGEIRPSEAVTLSLSTGTVDTKGLPSIPGYEILSELGRGGMGIVYRARQTSLDRIVALKMLLHGHQSTTADRSRFHTEAEALARLAHPHIVQIHEISEWQPSEGGPAHAYFAMEYCAGGALDGRLGQGPFTPIEAARLLSTLARTVQAAHDKGIVHRDLKPGNVLLTDTGQPKITDFGLAKRLDLSAAHTASGAILGTPAYMAPEQASSKTVGPAADIYALGVLLYECLTGKVPFLGATMGDTILQVLSEEPVPPRRLQPRLPNDLDTICLKCLEKDPSRRYPTALALAEDLDRFLAGEPIRAHPIGPLGRLGRWARRNPALAGLTATVALLLVMATAISTTQAIRLDRARTQAQENADRAEKALGEREDALTRLEQALRGEQAAAQVAREARSVAEGREKLAAQERARAETASYVGLIGLAERYWSSNQVELAERKLDLCPPGLRRWEWRFLKALCQAELSAVTGPPNQTGVSALSPDGRLVASVCESRSAAAGLGLVRYPVQVWDGGTGSTRFNLPLGAEFTSAKAMCFSPDSKQLAVVDADHTIKIFPVSGEEVEAPLLELQGHAGRVISLAYSSDGRTLLSGSLDGTVRRWSIADGKLLGTCKVSEGRIQVLACGPRAEVAVGLDTGAILYLDYQRGEAVRRWIKERHHRTVRALTFRTDGKQLLSGGEDGSVRLWDPAGGRELRVLAHSGPVTTVTFNLKGDQVVGGGEDRAVIVWDATTGREQLTLRGHNAPIQAMIYRAGGSELVVLDRQGVIKTWDARTGRVGLRLAAGPSGKLAIRPDSKQVATTDGSAIRLFALSTGEPQGSIDVGPDRQLREIAYTADSKRMVSIATFRQGDMFPQAEIFIWDLESRKLLDRITSPMFLGQTVALSRNGRWAGVKTTDNSVALWDLHARPAARTTITTEDIKRIHQLALAPDGRLAIAGQGPFQGFGIETPVVEILSPGRKRIAQFHEQEGPIQSITFGPLGSSWLATGSSDRLVHLWNVKPPTNWPVGTVWTTREPELVLRGHTGSIASIDFSPDGHRLITIGAELKLWALPDGEELLTWPIAGQSIAFGPRGRHLAIASQIGQAYLWDSNPVRDTLLLRDAGSVLSFVGSSQQLAVAGRDEGTSLWNLERVGQKARLAVRGEGLPRRQPEVIRALSTSAQGKLLATGAEDGTVRFWEPKTRRLVQTIHAHADRVTAVSFSVDSTMLASASADETVKIWEVASGKLLSTFTGHTDRVLCVAFHPDGKRAASGGEDRKVHIWDPQKGKSISSPLTHPDVVNAVAYQPGGSLLAVGCEDGIVYLCDNAGKRIKELKGHDDAVRALTFRFDGKRLVSAGWDRRLKVWDMDAGRELATLGGHAEGLTAVAYSPDGQWLASVDESMLVQIWNRID